MGQNLMCPHSGIPTPSRIMSSPTVHCKGTNSFGLEMSCYLLDLLAAFFPVQLRSKSAGNTYFLWKKPSTYKKSYSLFGKKRKKKEWASCRIFPPKMSCVRPRKKY